MRQLLPLWEVVCVVIEVAGIAFILGILMGLLIWTHLPGR